MGIFKILPVFIIVFCCCKDQQSKRQVKEDRNIMKIELFVKSEEGVHESYFLDKNEGFEFVLDGKSIKRNVDLSNIFLLAEKINRSDLNRVFNVNSNDNWEFDIFLYSDNSNEAYNIRSFGYSNSPSEIKDLILEIVKIQSSSN